MGFQGRQPHAEFDSLEPLILHLLVCSSLHTYNEPRPRSGYVDFSDTFRNLEELTSKPCTGRAVVSGDGSNRSSSISSSSSSTRSGGSSSNSERRSSGSGSGSSSSSSVAVAVAAAVAVVVVVVVVIAVISLLLS